MNPGNVLAARSQSSADEEPKRQRHSGKGAGILVEHDAASQQHDAGRWSGGERLVLPLRGEVARKSEPGGVCSVTGSSPRSVDADGGTADEALAGSAERSSWPRRASAWRARGCSTVSRLCAAVQRLLIDAPDEIDDGIGAFERVCPFRGSEP